MDGCRSVSVRSLGLITLVFNWWVCLMMFFFLKMLIDVIVDV